MFRLLLISLFTVAWTEIFAQPVLPDIAALLERNKSALELSAQDWSEYTISNAYTTEHLNITHVYLEQKYRDIRLFNGILNLNLRGDQLVSFGNRWIHGMHDKAPSPIPKITAQVAVERTADHLGHEFPNAVEIRKEQNKFGQDTKVIFSPGSLSRAEIEAELVWLKGDQKDIHLCWKVKIFEMDGENVWDVFIDAHTGAFIRKDNHVMQCAFDAPVSGFPEKDHDAGLRIQPASLMPPAPDSSYNVFALPVESPNHGARSVVVTPWTSAGAGHPAVTLGWHNNGTTAYTSTRGNNVHAYEDINHDNVPGFSPDTFNLRFDYPFVPSLDPTENLSACITNLFYWNNIMHDVMYQYGFDEVSGNFQNDNLGRGGAGADYVLAEAQDGQGINNANFYTPADGSKARMQMYIWSPVPETSPLTLNSPPSIAGPLFAVESDFSSANKLENIGLTTGNLVLVEDAGGMTHEACGTLSNADSLMGKIAVIDRGNCDFVVKVKNVQNLGAIAAIVVNNVSGSPFAMGGSDNTILIPAVMISLNDGNMLKAVMDTSVVNASLDSVPMITPDGDFDSGIISHEYGHGISIRLTGGPSNVSCLNNEEQMGEGWSDYFGLMLTTDWLAASATDPRGIGTYVIGESTEGTGIRTYPYTIDTTENPFTYADIADAPVYSGVVSPHFIGSVWCTMLWDMTWNIIDLAGVDPDMYQGTGGNNIALQLVTDALKLQPCNPGFVDGRDAILLADQLNYGGQYNCAIWKAFAGRGLGVNADQGSSNDYMDGVESFSIPDGVHIESTADVSEAGEGQEVTFSLKTTCRCEGKSNLEITDALSEDLIYIPGTGGTLSGNKVTFSADTLSAMDSLLFSYHAFIRPCSAMEDSILSGDDAEGPDQYESIKLVGNGPRVWVKSTDQAVSPTHSWYAKDYTSLSDFVLALIDPVITTGDPVEITFDHRYETEANYDGGVVEYSIDGGTTWLDAGPSFIENGYPATLFTLNTNPLAGRAAFTGNSDIQFDTTGFIHSTINLFFGGSQTLHLRFRFACDGSVGGPGINGWYIDNILIHQRSGLVNQTRVSADSVFVDSLYYSVRTNMFDGAILYVDSSATGDLNGLTWANAMHHLPMALGVAGCRSADSVFVAEGTYFPTLTHDRQISFDIPDSTSVFGGFPPGGSTFELRNPIMNVTELSGDLGNINDMTDNTYHVLKIDSTRQGALLDGVTLSYGNANGMEDDSQGAAVFCMGDLTLQHVTLRNNTGLTDGQLILIRNAAARLHLTDCTLFGQEDGLVKLLNTDSAQVIFQGNTMLLKE